MTAAMPPALAAERSGVYATPPALGALQQALLKEIQDYAAREGYDLIVGDGVLYVSNAVNITEEVLRAVEANYQATSNP